ncbi:hypothetical protein D3C85_1428040 [compost metagenome]
MQLRTSLLAHWQFFHRVRQFCSVGIRGPICLHHTNHEDTRAHLSFQVKCPNTPACHLVRTMLSFARQKRQEMATFCEAVRESRGHTYPFSHCHQDPSPQKLSLPLYIPQPSLAASVQACPANPFWHRRFRFHLPRSDSESRKCSHSRSHCPRLLWEFWPSDLTHTYQAHHSMALTLSD